jgi:uncharacterized protein (TIGR03000 family)
MYSIALLMALTGGNDVADSHRHGGCCGQVQASCGCYGGGRHHRERHCGGHRHHGGGCGCAGYQACNSCNTCNTCAPVSQGCCGCYGGSGSWGAPPPAAMPQKLTTPPTEKKTEGPAAATIVVELPADATLTVDGAVTTSTSNVRVLVSPELPLGKEFQYTLTAQVVRDGKPLQVEQTVAVRAGEESRVSLSLPVASVAQR